MLDSTPLLDAVATQDTVTQLRAAIRRLLTVAGRDDTGLAAAVRAVLMRDDDYATVGKPPCDWDDQAAREGLVDALVRDVNAALLVLDGREVAGAVAEAAELLALVGGQDVEQGEDGVFRIARRVARDRVISTVDTEARHGHKSRARTFDGYKAHLAVDPDDELITNLTVTPANTADRDVIDDLLEESDLAVRRGTARRRRGRRRRSGCGVSARSGVGVRRFGLRRRRDAGPAGRGRARGVREGPADPQRQGLLQRRVQRRHRRRHGGLPGRATAPIRRRRGGGGLARFTPWCAGCPLRAACTTARYGRVITIHPHEARLQQAKTAQRDPDWQQTYRTTRPTVERKIAHFTRRAWGGRRARCRGRARILTDVLTRAGAVNLAGWPFGACSSPRAAGPSPDWPRGDRPAPCRQCRRSNHSTARTSVWAIGRTAALQPPNNAHHPTIRTTPNASALQGLKSAAS